MEYGNGIRVGLVEYRLGREGARSFFGFLAAGTQGRENQKQTAPALPRSTPPFGSTSPSHQPHFFLSSSSCPFPLPLLELKLAPLLCNSVSANQNQMSTPFFPQQLFRVPPCRGPRWNRLQPRPPRDPSLAPPRPAGLTARDPGSSERRALQAHAPPLASPWPALLRTG